MKLASYPKYKSSCVDWVSEVPEHWQLSRIGALFRFCSGGTPDTDIEVFWGGDIPWVSAKDMKVLRITDSEDRITERAVSESATCVVPRGTVLLVARSGILRHTLPVAVAQRPVAINQDIKGLLPTTRRVDPVFFTYLVQGSQSALLTLWRQQGATVESLNVDRVKTTSVFLPPLHEQVTIAGFLDREAAKLDRLIASKRAMIARLTEKRMALISRAVTRGLPPDTALAADLDPHPKLKNSGIDWLGDVPEHWDVLPFTKYLADRADYRGKTPEKTDNGVFLVTAKNVRMGFIDYESSQEFVSEAEYSEIMRRGLPKYGDILFTTEAPLGNVALVDREEIALAQRIIRFRMNPRFFLSSFALYGMMSDHFQIQLQSLSTGSTAEGLKASKLPMLRLIAPPLSEQYHIVEFLDRETAKIDTMIAKTETAIERLQEYRSALVTAAVTGKIDVRGAA